MYMQVCNIHLQKLGRALMSSLGAGSFDGHEAAFFRGGSCVGQMDPTIYVSAMAAVSQSVAFGITGSTSYLTVSIVQNYFSLFDTC